MHGFAKMLVFWRVFGASYNRCLVLAILFVVFGLPRHGTAEDLTYPQLIRTRYEAVDPKIGGHFIVWLDREKMWHGLDQRLYPPVKYVDIRHVTPAAGSPPITLIELTAINSVSPEFYHVAGVVRLKVTGMVMKSTNAP
jgi:hypothetical protein